MKIFLKARCKLTDKRFGLEIEKEKGVPVITNFVDLKDEDYDRITPQYSVDPHIEVGSNLRPCKYCGSRKLGNCSCNKRKKSCKKYERYDYQCLFCDQLEIDYSGAKDDGTSFYNKVSLTNLPASAFDRHGNPQGDQFDLAKDGSMKGFSILMLDYSGGKGTREKLKAKLEKKGFNIISYTSDKPITDKELKKYVSKDRLQIWIISGRSENTYFKNKIVEVLYQYYLNGGSLYIWGDNEPLFVEANYLLRRMYNTTMYGNVPGDHIISIKTGSSSSGIIKDHPIATGIINFHEGQSIATVNCNQDLFPLVYGSDRTVIAAYHDSKARVIADGGFTRLSNSNINKAGTERFVINSAIWLAHIEKYGVGVLPKF